MKKLVTALGVGAVVVVALAAFAPRSWHAPGPRDPSAADRRVSLRQKQLVSQLLQAERQRHPALPAPTSEPFATANR